MRSCLSESANDSLLNPIDFDGSLVISGFQLVHFPSQNFQFVPWIRNYRPKMNCPLTSLGTPPPLFTRIETRVQVNSEGCIPAHDGNGSSRNVSCSKASLQAPLGRSAI